MQRSIHIIFCLLNLLMVGCKHEVPQEDIRMKIKTAELSTVEYTVRQIIRNSDETWKIFGDRKVLFSCKATIKAGINLQQLSDDDIQVNGHKVSLTLPKAQILIINMQPQDIIVAYSKISILRSDYTQQEVDAILRAGEYSIKTDQSLRRNILNEAERNASEFFELLLRSNGFTDITISFK